MLVKTLAAIITLFFIHSSAGAEMYQWVDESGVVTFRDTPPPASKKRKKVKTYSDSDFAPEPSRQTTAPESSNTAARSTSHPSKRKQEPFSGTVEIYVTDWCGYCKKAQSYLKSKGIPYVAYDIEKDSAANQRHKDLGGRGVPLIIIGSNKMSGFSEELLESYLNGR